MKKKKNICPVCGYDGLSEPAFDAKGNPSYEVCACCGFEFGFDSNNDPASFKRYRKTWLENGAVWFMPQSRPRGWKKERQLKGLLAVFLFLCIGLFSCSRSLAQELPANDAVFLSDYIDALGLAAKLRLCVKCADTRPQPSIDSVERAQAFSACYQSSKEELSFARELLARHKDIADPQLKELVERTEFIYGHLLEVVTKSSAIHEAIYQMWRDHVSDQKRINAYYRDLVSFDNERNQLQTLVLTACFRVRDEEKKRSGVSIFTVTGSQKQTLLKRLEGYFGPEVKQASGSYANGLCAAAAFLYEELNRQKDAQPAPAKPGEVYINTEYGIEFPVPDGYQWKQLDQRTQDPSGRVHVSLGIASMDLSGDDKARFGNSFITVSVYEFPHNSPVSTIDMPWYALLTIDPKRQKLRSGIASMTVNGFPAVYYVLDESVSDPENKEVTSLVFLVRLGPFKIMELVGTTLPRQYFNAYRLKFEEAFLGLKLAR